MSYARISIQNYYTNLLKLPYNNPTAGQDNQFIIGEYNRQRDELRDCGLAASRLKKANRDKCMIIFALSIICGGYLVLVFYQIYSGSQGSASHQA